MFEYKNIADIEQIQRIGKTKSTDHPRKPVTISHRRAIIDKVAVCHKIFLTECLYFLVSIIKSSQKLPMPASIKKDQKLLFNKKIFNDRHIRTTHIDTKANHLISLFINERLISVSTGKKLSPSSAVPDIGLPHKGHYLGLSGR